MKQGQKSQARKVKFGDVVRLSNARSQDPLADGFERYVGLEHLEPGNLRLRTWGNVADGVTFTSIFQPGQVLFGKRRAYQRKVAVADFAGVCSGDIYVLESKDPSVLLPDLLPFICQTDAFFEHAVGTSAGSLSPRTNWSSLAAFVFKLPPMEEQRSTVALLSAVATLHDTLDDAYVAVARTLQAFKDGAHVRSEQVATTLTLGDLLIGSPDSGCSAPPKDEDTGYFVLGLSSLSRHGYGSGDFKPVEPTRTMLSAKLKTGDLLISRSNTLDRVGFAGIFSDEREDVSFPDTMMRLRPNLALIDPRYLEMLLQTTTARKFLMGIAAGTSASMKKINRANLLKMALVVPPLRYQQPVLEQMHRIVDGLASLKRRQHAAQRMTKVLIGNFVREGE